MVEEKKAEMNTLLEEVLVSEGKRDHISMGIKNWNAMLLLSFACDKQTFSWFMFCFSSLVFVLSLKVLVSRINMKH